MNCIKNILWIVLFFAIAKITYPQSGWIVQTNPIPPSNTNTLGKIQFVTPTEGWISAADGNLLHTTDAGTTWDIVTPFPNDTVSSMADPSITMCWIDQNHGWKINSLGTGLNDAHGAVLQQTTNAGANWTKKVLSSMQGDIGLEVQFVDKNNGWVLIYNLSSGNAQLLRTTDGGNNWDNFNGMGIFDFVDANNGWAISSGPMANPPFKIYHTENGGIDWSEQYVDSTSGGYNAIQFTDSNYGWIVGDSAKILKTTDGGSSWEKITNDGINSNSRSKCVFFLDENTGWIGTNDGVIDNNPARIILYTENGGTTWTKQQPPITDAVFSIFFWDKNNGWLTADNCVQNCNEPDSLRIWQGAICHMSGSVAGIVKENNSTTPNFTLLQNYPNPFNPVTTINYSVSKSSLVTITIYNILGKKVATLVNELKNTGNYSVEFNTDKLASGIYLYKMQAGNFMATKKMILLR